MGLKKIGGSTEKIEKFLKFGQTLLGDIDPKKTVLLIIDMQKYQVQAGCSAYKSMNTISEGILDYFVEEVQKKVVPNLREFIKFCREVKIPIIYTKYASFMVDGTDLPKTIQNLNKVSKEFVGEVTFPHISHPDSEIIEELKPSKEDWILQKNTSGTFISTRLDSFLRNMNVETVLVGGVVTNFCVHSTAREAADYGFQTIIIEDCCAAWAPEIHDSSLRSFDLLYGFVLPYEKIIKKITRKLKKTKKAPVAQ